MKSGYITVLLSAQKLQELSYPFAVIIEGRNIKAYIVTKEIWNKVCKAYEEGLIREDISEQFPLVTMTKDLLDTASQFNWVIVGESI